MELVIQKKGEEELTHWGIKGQKWGVRRFQNEDGTYTEEGIKRYNKKYPYQDANTGSLNERGQKEFMKAARKGKLDYRRLSDKELDMINNRFNKEEQFKRNVENYEKSTFKYKAKEAVLNRIKGNGGGGGGKGKGKGGSGLSGILAAPIKKAIEDALKFDPGKGGDEGNKGNNTEESKARTKAWIQGTNGKKKVRDFCTDDRITTGKNAMFKPKTRDDHEDSSWNTSTRSSEDILRNRYKPKPEPKKKTPKPVKVVQSGTDEYWKSWSFHAGMPIYAITRNNLKSDELMHYGIKGQKWGVRRFENADGTLTPEGKERYRGGPIGDKEYGELKRLRGNVDEANKKWSKSEWGPKRQKAEKERHEAYSELDRYGEDLVKNFAKSDPEFKDALEKRKKAGDDADAEWKRISDQKHIDSVASNKADPRHRAFEKVGDHYEFTGDGTEFWETMASEKAQKQLYDAEISYHKDCHKALCKMFSNIMDKPIRRAINEKNIDEYNSLWPTKLMQEPVINRMSEYMEIHYDLIED